MKTAHLLGITFLLTLCSLFSEQPTNYKLIYPKKRWINRYIETIGQIQVHKEQSSNQISVGSIYPKSSSPYIMSLYPYPKITKPSNNTLLSQTETGEYTVVFFQPHHLLKTLISLQEEAPLKTEVFLSNQDPYPYLSTIDTIQESEKNKQLIRLTAKYRLNPKSFWPNDYIHVRLYLSKEKLYTLPKATLLKDKSGYYVYIAPKSSNSIEKQYVKIGQEEGNDYVILQGLTSDAIVVLPL